MTEPALPGMPEPPPVKPRPVADKVRISRTKQTFLCQECCQLIHALGQSVAAYPRGGRWRVVKGQSVTYLCDAHLPEPEWAP